MKLQKFSTNNIQEYYYGNTSDLTINQPRSIDIQSFPRKT